MEKQQATEDCDNLNERLQGLELTEDNPPTPETLKLFDEWGDRAWAIHSSEDALLALEEMRIVFLFKSVEIAIKEMVATAFPKLNTKDSFDRNRLQLTLKPTVLLSGDFLDTERPMRYV